MTAGRPTAFKPEFIEQAKKLCEFGATDNELAEFFNVHSTTIWRWQAAHPEFCNALKAGKDAADERVVRSLYHRAVGYTHDAVKIFNAQGEPLIVPYKEHVPPDTTAAIFWLKNRQRQQWRDVHDHVHTSEEARSPEQMKADLIDKIAEMLGETAPGSAAVN